MTKDEVITHIEDLIKIKQTVFTVLHSTDQHPFEKIENFRQIGNNSNNSNKRNVTSMDNTLKIVIDKISKNKTLPDANPAMSLGNKHQVYNNFADWMK